MPPDNSFDIDHLLIGPAGVIVLDSKNYSGRVRLNDDTLWTGKYPLSRELAAAQRHADHVGEVLGVDAAAALCIHTARLPAEHFNIKDIDVLSPHRLVDWLVSRPWLLLHMQIVAIAAAARARYQVLGLPEQPTERQPAPAPAPPADARPGDVPPAPPPRLPPPPLPPVPPPPRPPSNRGRPVPPRGRRHKRRVLRNAVANAITIVLAPIVLYAVMSSFIHTWGRSIARSAPKASVTSPAPVASAATPPVLAEGAFSCPGRGRGWTLTMRWPSGNATAYRVRWSQAPDGPWSATPAWQRGSSLSITGLRSASHVFVRAQDAAAGEASPESMAMQKTPSSPC
jgi:hypothetical protein